MGSYVESYKVLPKKNYYGAYGKKILRVSCPQHAVGFFGESFSLPGSGGETLGVTGVIRERGLPLEGVEGVGGIL